MFAKTWQIRKLYNHVFQKQKLSVTVISFIEIISTIGLVFLVQLSILVIWTAVYPIRSTTIIVDPINLTEEYACHGDHVTEWVTTQAAFYLLLLMWGVYVIYSTWNAKKVLESRWLLIASYNLFLLICVVLPFVYLLENTGDKAIFYLAVIPINFGTMSTILSVCTPAVMRMVMQTLKESSSPSRTKSYMSRSSNSVGTDVPMTDVSRDVQSRKESVTDNVEQSHF
jgi:hypothetical protein